VEGTREAEYYGTERWQRVNSIGEWYIRERERKRQEKRERDKNG